MISQKCISVPKANVTLHSLNSVMSSGRLPKLQPIYYHLHLFGALVLSLQLSQETLRWIFIVNSQWNMLI